MTRTVLQLRDRRLTTHPGAPLLMGVVNASPESFSDGAESATLDRQLARAQALLDAGADLLDVGGESGVTNRAPISAEAEIERVLPLVTELVAAGVGALTNRSPAARLAGTLAAIGEGVDAGASILRVHDVGHVSDFLEVRKALRGHVDVSPDLHLPVYLRREPTADSVSSAAAL